MRSLTFDLDLLQTARVRRRAFKFEVYDVVSSRSETVPDNISRVVQANLGASGVTLASITGPRDFSDEVEVIQFDEKGSDFTQGSLAGNSLQVTIADRHMMFDPVEGDEPRWLRQGNVVVLREGDESVDPADWAITFTGTIVGRAGSSGPDRSGNSKLTLFAEDRLLSNLKHAVTTEDIPQGVALQDMMRTVMEDELLFSSDEIDFGAVGATHLTSQASTQLVDDPPMIMLAKLGFPDGFVPRFRGNGVLEMAPNFVDRSAAVIYDNDNLFERFERPFSPLETPNRVEIVGLNKNQEKISQPRQVLATAGLTLGFFGGDASIRVKFSDDETQQADDTELNLKSSVTGALIPFGEEEWIPIIDDDGGCRGGRIDVEGSFYAPLVVNGFAGRIAAGAIPDGVGAFGGGSTICIGRLIEAAITVANQIIMATIGRGDYEIKGTPYEWVFRELKGVAQIDGVDVNDLRTLTVENHLLDTQERVDNVALRELRTVRKRGNVFNVTMRHDLRLEPMDKFLLANGREFIIDSISRSVGRDATERVTVVCYESTPEAIP